LAKPLSPVKAGDEPQVGIGAFQKPPCSWGQTRDPKHAVTPLYGAAHLPELDDIHNDAHDHPRCSTHTES
jgi:hypothetical protein